MTDTPHPIRVVHVLGSLDEGGVGNWLMRLVRGLNAHAFSFTACVERVTDCPAERELAQRGGRLVQFGRMATRAETAEAFRKILHETGGADVVQLHRVPYRRHTLVPLAVAAEKGVPLRILHLRQTLRRYPLIAKASDQLPWTVRLQQRWQAFCSNRRLADLAHATNILAVSEQSAASLLGPMWMCDPRMAIAYSGIDLEPFRSPVDPAAVRASCNIPDDALVLLHTGGFREIKNQAFLVDVLQALRKRVETAHLVFVGEGDWRERVEERVRDAGLSHAVHFLGQRTDVPALLMGLGDVFVLPSHAEGLACALLEAQAAGLPCIASTGVPAEVQAIAGRVHFLPLAGGAEEWADAAWRLHTEAGRLPVDEALALMQNGRFDMHHSCTQMERLYRTAEKGGK